MASSFWTDLRRTDMEREPADWREARRLRAYDLKQQGWKQTDIAEALGVTDGAVSQWMSRAEAAGREALYRSVAPGNEPRLCHEDRQKLPALLEQGAAHYGFRGDRWTRNRVGRVIEREFGVCYHDTQVGRILAEIGWTLQKPAKRASERDEEAIEAWRDAQWEVLKKSRNGEQDPCFH